jgi:hypothetical protein
MVFYLLLIITINSLTNTMQNSPRHSLRRCIGQCNGLNFSTKLTSQLRFTYFSEVASMESFTTETIVADPKSPVTCQNKMIYFFTNFSYFRFFIPQNIVWFQVSMNYVTLVNLTYNVNNNSRENSYEVNQ